MQEQYAFSFLDPPGDAAAVQVYPLRLPDADVVFYAGIFTAGESAQMFVDLQTTVA